MRLVQACQNSEYHLFYTMEGFYVRLSDMITFDQCDL